MPMPVAEVMSVVARLPTKLGIVFVHFSEVLVMSVDVQKNPIDTAERHKVRFVLVIFVIAESLLSRADCAVSWTAAMTPVVEPSRAIESCIATYEAEAGATCAEAMIGNAAILATMSYCAPWA